MMTVVAGLLTRADGRVLMHRRPPEKHHGGLWEFPGGKVENGEFPRAALCRELAEELAIGVDEASLRPAAFADRAEGAGGEPHVILLYTVASWSGLPVPQDEGAELGWFTQAELLQLPRPPLDVALCAMLFRGLDGGAPG
jgi:8-oxo-dGTP diphosphatase